MTITLSGGHCLYALQAVLLELWPNWIPLKGLPGPHRSGVRGKCSLAEQRGEALARGCAAPPGTSCWLTAAPKAICVAGSPFS
ncbi:hypothetical protein E2C01_045207 [Portunus trituberculatus]|uniref:Uncharacterized protein n=1 Tax=Portunus trituberculatus TaxID=210409 RepID=A0A5B7G273_PORTR|nr:hypothetical protein [Portunus trituberculatus]